LLPLLNAGRTDIDNYDFHCGAKIRIGVPEPVETGLNGIIEANHVSQTERWQFRLARAWLWIESNEIPGGLSGPRNEYAICSELAGTVWTLRWLIDLAGAGENDFWRNGNIMHCAGPYAFSRDLQIPWSPPRRHFIYSPPSYTQRMASWSEERLNAADRIQRSFERDNGETIPRLALANNLKSALTTYPARDVAIRFAMAVTAMETLFIAPSEPGRSYLWSEKIQKRIRQVCPGVEGIGGDFFQQVRNMRNDAVHRGGWDKQGNPIKFIDVHAKFEEVLRASLRWGLLSQAEIADPFDKDEWPNPSQSTLDLCRSLNQSLFVQPANAS